MKQLMELSTWKNIFEGELEVSTFRTTAQCEGEQVASSWLLPHKKMK